MIDYSIRLSFCDWTRRGRPVRDEQSFEASMGDFHGGTLFDGTIALDGEQLADLKDSLSKGLEPKFLLHAPKNGEKDD